MGYYIWIDAEGYGPSQSFLIDTINDTEYKIDEHLFDNWTLKDVYEIGLQRATLAPNSFKKCNKFTISCQSMDGEVIIKREFTK